VRKPLAAWHVCAPPDVPNGRGARGELQSASRRIEDAPCLAGQIRVAVHELHDHQAVTHLDQHQSGRLDREIINAL
jgi:hypothetical protein